MANLLVNADTAPTVTATITHTTTGLPVSLSGCTVKFQMRLATERAWRIDAAATVEDAAAGTVSYDLVPGDLDFAGECLARFLVIYPDNRRQHTVPATAITVEAQ